MIQLNEKQAIAVSMMCDYINSDSDKLYFAVQGEAGTGKTTIVKHLIELNEHIKFIIAAPTNVAVGQLISSCNINTPNVEYLTVAKVLQMKPNFNQKEILFEQSGSGRRDADVIIIDEKSMIDTETYAKLVSLGVKMIFLGDKYQIPPVNSVPMIFEDDIVLTENMRFKENHLLDKVKDLIELENQQHEQDNFNYCYPYSFEEESKELILFNPNDFVPGEDLAIAFTNEKKDYINDIIRRVHSINPEEDYWSGDTLLFNEPVLLNNGQMFVNGSIETIAYAEKSWHVLGEDDILYHDPKWHGQKFKTYKIYLEGTNGYFTTLANEDYVRWSKMLNERAEVYRKTKKNWYHWHQTKAIMSDVSHYLCVTSHKAQGKTCNNAFVLLEDFHGRFLKSYGVAISRARFKTNLIKL